MPGPKGLELMETVSQEAWESWKSHQTTLINEKHLDLSQADARSWLLEQMEKFFNNEESESQKAVASLPKDVILSILLEKGRSFDGTFH